MCFLTRDKRKLTLLFARVFVGLLDAGLAIAILTLAINSYSFAASVPLTPGNIIISHPYALSNSIVEYRLDGTLVQIIEVPHPNYLSAPGGIAFDDQTFLRVYNGNHDPYLSSWNDETDTWDHWSCSGWSSYACFPCQGIGTINNYVFATDEGSYGNPNGLVRFDRQSTNCIRFSAGINYSTLAVGLDDILYARRSDNISPPPPTMIDVFDPTTLELIKTVTLTERSLTIAADKSGHLYGVSGQSILHFDETGLLLNAHQVINDGALYTITLSSDNHFIVVSSEGEVVVTNSSFVELNRFWILTGLPGYAAMIPSEPMADSDGDGVLDDQDKCPNTLHDNIVDRNGCSVDQLVPCSGPASGGVWDNHGRYVSAVARTAEVFVTEGLIENEQKAVIVSTTAQNNCGK